MGQTFSAAVNEWVLASKERALAVLKESAEDFVAEVATRTPVDTGYLRSSLTGRIGNPAPLDPLIKRDKPHGYDNSPATLVIAGWDGGEPLYVTFTASYAPYVEYGTSKMAPRAMVRVAAQNWPAIVARNATSLRAQVEGTTR